MRTGTLRTTEMEEVQLAEVQRSFSFTSGDRELAVTGMLQRIETPAIGGDDANSHRGIKAPFHWLAGTIVER